MSETLRQDIRRVAQLALDEGLALRDFRALVTQAWSDVGPSPWPDIDAEIIEAAGRGRTQLETIRRLPNHSRSRVIARIKALGVKLRDGRGIHRRKTDRNAVIVAAVRSGDFTLQDVAREHGITRERVRQIAKKAGIVHSPARSIVVIAHRNGRLTPAERKAQRAEAKAERQRKREALIAAMLEMHLRGATQGDIGAAFGFSQGKVSRLLTAAGHRMRSFGDQKANLRAAHPGRRKRQPEPAHV